MAGGQNTALLAGIATATAGALPSSVQDKFKSGVELASKYGQPPAQASTPTLPAPSGSVDGGGFTSGSGPVAWVKKAWGTTLGKVGIVGGVALLGFGLYKKFGRKR